MNHLDQLVRDTLVEHADAAPPAAPAITRALQEGRPARRFPVLAASVATVAAVSAAVVGTAVLHDPEPQAPVGSEGPSAGAGGALEQCLALGADALPAAHWGAGSRVLTSAAAGGQTRAVLVSADEQQWADCHLLSPAGDQGLVLTYPMAVGPLDGHSEFSYSSSRQGRTSLSMAERFPANVAEVRLAFASGKTFTAEAVDGFVVFEIAADADHGRLDALLQYDDAGRLVGGPGLAPGDADLPRDQRSLVPAEPLDTVVVNDNL